MRYLPHTEEDIASMLETVGAKSLDGLFECIPEECRFGEELNLPKAMTEWELDEHMAELAHRLAVSPEYKVFAGAGSYHHYIPESINYLISRSEFLTAYTPYQPEMAQGTLQAIYEYQTLTARLLGMDIANASLYDGATALAEALLMAIRVNGRKRVVLSSLIHPLYRRVVQTYFRPTDYEIIELPYTENGTTDLSVLDELNDIAAVAVQSPNFLGCIENLDAAASKAHAGNALLIASFTEPLAFGLFKNPGTLGADIACGEGQSLGIPRSFGGPALGMFACRKQFMRKMPGRLVGETHDMDGKRGFVLTLATREQHIRREKATSNICTNNSLNALKAAMYMASVGGSGFRELAKLNYDKAGYLKTQLQQAGFKISFDTPTFNEFVVEFPADFETTYRRLIDRKIIAGLRLAPFYPELDRHYLLCVTETTTKTEMDDLIREVKS